MFKRLGQKKIGHGGTLDPLASGVLLLLLGQATKLSGYLLGAGRKIYSGQLRLGLETDSWDSQGKLLWQSPVPAFSETLLAGEIAAWQGINRQLVPPVSAAKHNGQPLYKLARKGLAVPEKIRTVEIYEADILEIRMPFINFRVACSSGSYIRSLAHSLGKRLGCGAILTGLVREYSHPFALQDSVSPETVSERPEDLASFLQPIQKALPDWPCVELDRTEVEAVRNGRQLPARTGSYAAGTMAILCDNGTPVALGRLAGQDGRCFWQVQRGLWI